MGVSMFIPHSLTDCRKKVCKDIDPMSAPKSDGPGCEVCKAKNPKSAPKSDGTGCEVCQNTNSNFAPKSDGSACEDCGAGGPSDDGTRCKLGNYFWFVP